MELIIYRKVFVAVFALILVPGCNGYEKTSDPEKMYDIASGLKDVATSVDGLVKFGNGKSLTESELILEAVNQNRSRLNIFQGFELHVKIEGNNSSLLLCKGDEAMIEDTGCTPESDLNHWRSASAAACEFTIDLQAICQ